MDISHHPHAHLPSTHQSEKLSTCYLQPPSLSQGVALKRFNLSATTVYIVLLNKNKRKEKKATIYKPHLTNEACNKMERQALNTVRTFSGSVAVVTWTNIFC